MIRFILTLLFLVICGLQMQAGSIRGIITDSIDAFPLYGANVRIVNTTLGAMVNAQGKFTIDRLSKGVYTLRITYVGYSTKEIEVNLVNDNALLTLSIQLMRKDVNALSVIVSAGKRTQSIQEVPVSVSLLDQQAIQQRNVQRIDEVLRYVPGVNVARDQVSIRGSSGFALGIGSRVALLLDGFPMLSADNGDMKFDALPMMEINRVEVVKGAGSALYGTGALGGVVSLFTRIPVDTARIIVRTYGGFYTQPKYEQWRVYESSPELYGIDAGYSKKFDNLEITLNAGRRYDKSYRLSDQSSRYNGFAKLGYTFDKSGTSKITYMLNVAKEDKGDWVFWNSLDSATRPPTNTNLNRKTHSGKIATAIDFKHFFSNNSFLQVRTGVFATSFENSGLLPGEEQIASDAQSYNTEIQYSTSLYEGLFVTSGINYIANIVEAPIYGTKKQNFISGYIQTEIKPGIEGLVFTAGGRIDKEQTEDFTSNLVISPKIAGSWLTPFGIQFRASIGKGFRAATVAERYAALRFQGITVEPNLSVKPEFSTSYEIGLSTALPISQDADMLLFDIAYFNNAMDDLVEPSFTPSGNIRFQNVTKAMVQGLEVSVKSMFSSGFGVEGSLTLMDPVDLTLQKTLSYRSTVLLYTRLSIPLLQNLLFQSDYRYISMTDNIDERLTALGFIPDADARVPNHICDMRLLLNVQPWVNVPMSVTLNAKNVFDYYYTEIMGNLAPIRQLTVQTEIVL